MASRVGEKIKLTSIDELLCVPETNGTIEIELGLISAFENHPFRVVDDEKMEELVESIRQQGILSPVLVRPDDEGGYEMISGHRRLHAAKIVGLKKIPAIVRELTDDEAIIAMVNANLQREEILPSERGFSLKMKMDAMKRQTGRPSKENGATVLPHLSGKRSREILAEQAGESHEQIRKLIRLTYLIPEILEMVDNSVLKEKDKLQIALRPAVELSYLTEQEQRDLHETMMTEDRTPSHAQAIKMRKFSQDGRLNMDVIFSIMQEEKPNQKEQLKIPKDRISKYFAPGTPVQKMEDTIIKALELYRKRQRDLQR